VENLLKPLPSRDYGLVGGTALALFYYHQKNLYTINNFPLPVETPEKIIAQKNNSPGKSSGKGFINNEFG
jgi:hypothetical protein